MSATIICFYSGVQCRSKGNISGGARKCWRPEPLGGFLKTSQTVALYYFIFNILYRSFFTFKEKKLGGGHGPPGPSPCYGTGVVCCCCFATKKEEVRVRDHLCFAMTMD